MASFMDDAPEMAVNLTMETDATQNTAVAEPDSGDTAADSRKYDGLVATVYEEFQRSVDKRRDDEQRWLECYRNYRGIYGSTTKFTDKERSKVFIKITKTKVQAAVAQIVDVLFAGNKFPLGIDPLNTPVGVEKAINFDPKGQQQGQPTRNPQMDPHIEKLFGPKKKILEPLQDQLQSGVGLSPTAITFEPAKEAARAMENTIQDQLEEANASKSLRSLVFELSLLGTGIYKGPLLTEKEYPRWEKDGTYNPIKKSIPMVEYVSVWDAYPDADARNMAEAEKFIQRHRLSRTELRGLKKRPHFRDKAIENLIMEGPNYIPQYWEHSLVDDNDQTTYERWEVLEYWGVIDAEMAKEKGLKIPKQFKDLDQIQVNAWVSGGHVLRLVYNPFVPVRIPYHAVPYEINPYSFFGIGIAENMLDTQLLMNGFMRMAVDNAALSSNVIFEVNEDLMAPGQSMELYPGKIFRRQGGAPGNAINAQKIDNVTNETLLLFDKARQLADEATGMPSYSHGMTGIQGTNRTASGMSMLMSAAAQNIKAVVRNIDDYLLTPLGKDLFAFNMQFNFKEDFIGDLAVVAKGTESLMRNEVRSQKLLQLGQFAASNPSMAPLVKWDYILREYAASLDLDEDVAINDPRQAAVQAAQMAQLQQIQGVMPPAGPAQPGGPALPGGQGIPNPNEPTQQGGNVQPGAAPEPGAEGFTQPGAMPQGQPQ